MTWQDWATFLRRHAHMLALAALAGGLAAAAGSLMVSPVYEASVLLRVQTNAQSSLLPFNEAARGSGMAGWQYELAAQAQVVRSRAVLEGAWKRIKPESASAGLLREIQILKGRVRASAVRGTNLLRVTVSDTSPLRVRDLANALAQELATASVKRKRAEARSVREFLDTQVTKVWAELERSEASLLPRAVRVHEEIYRTLLAKRHEASIAEHSKLGDVEIIDPAVKPELPVRPLRTINTLLGVILGFAVGFAGAWWREVQADTIKSVEELEGLSSVPVLGWIPQNPVKGNQDDLTDPLELLKGRGTSVQLEPYHLLASHFDLFPSEQPHQSILITSALPKEGKTRIITGLAVAMALEGRRVALVEGDFRNPALSRRLNLAGPGLVEVLTRKASLDEAVRPMTAAKLRLSILPAGQVSEHPSGLLSATAFGDIINSLRKRFEVILVDSSPILITSETLKIAAAVDGVVHVVEAGRVPRRVLKDALKKYKLAGVNLLGMVMNKVARDSIPYPSSYESYYYSPGNGSRTQVKDTSAIKKNKVKT